MLSLKRQIYGLPILRPYRLYRAKRAFGKAKLMPEGFEMVSFPDAFSPDYETEERRIIAKLLPHSTMLIDIGANHGFYSLLANHLNKPALAVEPEEINLKVLRSNAEGKPIQICPVALSDHEGHADLYGDGYMASLDRSWQGMPSHFRQKVCVTTLDKLLENVRGNLLIKMDVEGAEAAVLRGASKTLSGDHAWLIESYPTQPSGDPCLGFVDVFQMMHDAGYVARLVSESGRQFTMTDVKNWDRSTALPSNFLFYKESAGSLDIIKICDWH